LEIEDRAVSLAVQCELCPKQCRIGPGQSGDCRIRVNIDGRLVAVTYGYPVTVHVDPMEKKPLFHFLPGQPVFSLATVGCNLHCNHCQNWEISQAAPDEVPAHELPPEEVARLAAQSGCKAVAYTYTEPLVYYEYTYDASVACRERGLRNVLVTAGYINPEPLRRLCEVVDGAIIDLKAMSDQHYREYCQGTLEPVLNTLRIAYQAGVWVEVLNLLIPTVNDHDDLVDGVIAFVRDEMGPEVPLHFTAFHPDYQLRNLPRTPQSALERARDRAVEAGLRYVYVGNVMGSPAENTYCHHCGTLLIGRVGYRITAFEVVVATGSDGTAGGSCPNCGTAVAGVWG